MRVLWTPEAEQDRDDIWDHIAIDNGFSRVLAASDPALKGIAIP